MRNTQNNILKKIWKEKHLTNIKHVLVHPHNIRRTLPHTRIHTHIYVHTIINSSHIHTISFYSLNIRIEKILCIFI